MSTDTDKILAIVADSEKLIHDDNVVIKQDDELLEEDLDLVSAAAMPDFRELLARINKKNS